MHLEQPANTTLKARGVSIHRSSPSKRTVLSKPGIRLHLGAINPIESHPDGCAGEDTAKTAVPCELLEPTLQSCVESDGKLILPHESIIDLQNQSTIEADSGIKEKTSDSVAIEVDSPASFSDELSRQLKPTLSQEDAGSWRTNQVSPESRKYHAAVLIGAWWRGHRFRARLKFSKVVNKLFDTYFRETTG